MTLPPSPHLPSLMRVKGNCPTKRKATSPWYRGGISSSSSSASLCRLSFFFCRKGHKRGVSQQRVSLCPLDTLLTRTGTGAATCPDDKALCQALIPSCTGSVCLQREWLFPSHNWGESHLHPDNRLSIFTLSSHPGARKESWKSAVRQARFQTSLERKL